MKLLFCTECCDVFSLKQEQVKSCSCGLSSGKYIDEVNATYTGKGVPLGFVNMQFIHAIKYQPKKGMGKVFTAFVISEDCETFVKEEK